jgi:C1A family cysteine protease
VVRDTPDHRDRGVFRLAPPVLLPAAVNLAEYLGPVKDQGQEGSCFAFAGAGQREFLYRSYGLNEKTQHLASADAVFSAQYLFYRVHEMEGTLQDDCGAQLRSVCKTMNSAGVCLEKSEPYDPAKAWVAPTTAQDSEARSFQAGAYHRLSTVDDMKSCLASGYTFVAGFAAYASFEGKQWMVSGMMPVPKKKEALLGGHAVLFFGYDDERQAFKVRNSWGEKWCLGGNFWFPYRATADSNILWDAWIQHLGKAW